VLGIAVAAGSLLRGGDLRVQALDYSTADAVAESRTTRWADAWQRSWPLIMGGKWLCDPEVPAVPEPFGPALPAVNPELMQRLLQCPRSRDLELRALSKLSRERSGTWQWRRPDRFRCSCRWHIADRSRTRCRHKRSRSSSCCPDSDGCCCGRAGLRRARPGPVEKRRSAKRTPGSPSARAYRFDRWPCWFCSRLETRLLASKFASRRRY